MGTIKKIMITRKIIRADRNMPIIGLGLLLNVDARELTTVSNK